MAAPCARMPAHCDYVKLSSSPTVYSLLENNMQVRLLQQYKEIERALARGK